MADEPCMNCIKFNEAQDYCMTIADPITRNLVFLVLSVLVRNLLKKQPLPDGQFDVLYFVKLVEQAMSKHDVIQSYLDGEDDTW